jgi:hypothetical protein
MPGTVNSALIGQSKVTWLLIHINSEQRANVRNIGMFKSVRLSEKELQTTVLFEEPLDPSLVFNNNI